MPGIVGHQCCVARQGMCGDHQIEIADRLALGLDCSARTDVREGGVIVPRRYCEKAKPGFNGRLQFARFDPLGAVSQFRRDDGGKSGSTIESPNELTQPCRANNPSDSESKNMPRSGFPAGAKSTKVEETSYLEQASCQITIAARNCCKCPGQAMRTEVAAQKLLERTGAPAIPDRIAR